MVSNTLISREFDAGTFSSGFLFIIVPAVVLSIAGALSSVIRYARRRRRQTTPEDENIEDSDSADRDPHHTISPSLITQLQTLSPEPYALSLDAVQRTADRNSPLTPLPTAQLRYPYER